MSTALVIMAHPDDAEVLAGGTIITLLTKGWEVYLVLCTDGECGGFWNEEHVASDAREQLKELRRIEQSVATHILGVTGVIYLHYPDGLLAPSMRLRKDIAKVIRVYKPDRVICPSPEINWHTYFSLNHPDHLACGEATLAAFYPSSGNAWDFPDLLEEGWKPHRVSEIFLANPSIPNWYIEISEEMMEIKQQAIQAHLSQFSQKSSFVEDVRLWNRKSGQQRNLAYAEEFYRIEHP